jgi:regulator of Ty1 transposition protein 103
MAYYSDDAIRAKLSSLNEAQDVIVNVAQWLLFNRRNAVRTAEIWMQRVRDSPPPKRLSLVYLANEVVQQSKLRKKSEFVDAFTPHIAEGVGVAYRSASVDVQLKLKRVVEVWRARAIFDPKTQADVEGKMDGN